MLQSRDYLWDAEIVAIREVVPEVAAACVMFSVPGYVPSPQTVAAYVPSHEVVTEVTPVCVMVSVQGYVPSPQTVAAYVPSHEVVPEVVPVCEIVAWYAPPPVSVAICCIYLKDCTYP